MTIAPGLLSGKRRMLAIVLVALALAEAVMAVLFAAGLNRLMAQSHPPLPSLIAASVVAVLAGCALLLQRWVGERFAQGYVTDCRAALFDAVTRHAGEGGDARWLTVLINDMAALRNYALRGTVRLWTSAVAAGAAAMWVAVDMPWLRAALVPLLLAGAAIIILAWPLARAVTAQRAERGRLNRFLVRRVRAELTSAPVVNGHGFRKLSELSSSLERAAIHRAALAGTMDAVASIAGLAAPLILVWQSLAGTAQTGLAGGVMLLGFIAARLIESARALHARVGGRIALDRLEERLAIAARRPSRRRKRRDRTKPVRALAPRLSHSQPLALARPTEPLA